MLIFPHSSFQLILFMALASGKSSIRTGPLSLHTETAIYIAQLLTQVSHYIVIYRASQNCIGLKDVLLGFEGR